jgi:plastocyanin
VSRKLSRLVLVASVAAGFGLAPMVGGVLAAGQQRAVDVFNEAQGGFNSGNDKLHQTQIEVGDSVIWYIKEGSHTITPSDPSKWDDEDGSGGELEEGKDYTALFPKAGNYPYYCEVHGSKDDKAPNGVAGMSGLIVVRDPAAPPPPPPPSSSTTTTAPATTTTRPAAPGTTPTTSAPASATGTHTPSSAGPARTTTTTAAKGDKNKKQKDDPTTTTTEVVPPPPAPVDIPDSAIIPALPGSDQLPTSTEIQQGAIGEPGSAPEGEAIALLKTNKRGGNGVKLLIASGLGLGALGLGTAGYKFANRSSKYFPA